MRIRVSLVPSEEFNAGTARLASSTLNAGREPRSSMACPRGGSSHGRTRRHTHLHPVSGPPGGE